MIVASWLLAAVAAPFVAWWTTWAALALRATRPVRRAPDPEPKRLDVVIPAHDEEARIGDLLASLANQQGPSRVGEVVVVADHCSDGTVEIARAAGVTVIDRQDGAPGKPPALREGVARLRERADRADAVVFLDGDCVCAPDFVDELARRLGEHDQVVQAAYTLDEPDRGATRSSLRLAFSLRNVVRSAGADALGIPVVLAGSGMLFRWEALDHLSFGDPRIEGTGDTRPVADDVLMALDLVSAGIHPRLARRARVWAPTPGDDRALGAQRLRWEGGQALMWRRVPRVARRLAARGDLRGLLGLLDWTAPPLVPSVLVVGTVGVIGAAGAAAGVLAPVAVVVPAAAGASLAVFLVAGVGQLEGGRAVADLVLGAPRFLTWKARLYLRHGDARRPSEQGP